VSKKINKSEQKSEQKIKQGEQKSEQKIKSL